MRVRFDRHGDEGMGQNSGQHGPKFLWLPFGWPAKLARTLRVRVRANSTSCQTRPPCDTQTDIETYGVSRLPNRDLKRCPGSVDGQAVAQTVCNVSNSSQSHAASAVDDEVSESLDSSPLGNFDEQDLQITSYSVEAGMVVPAWQWCR